MGTVVERSRRKGERQVSVLSLNFCVFRDVFSRSVVNLLMITQSKMTIPTVEVASFVWWNVEGEG